MAKEKLLIGKTRAIMFCCECGKVIGVDYACENTEVRGDCFCVDCHNAGIDGVA